MIRIIIDTFLARGLMIFGYGDEVMKESSIIYVARRPRILTIIWADVSQIWITSSIYLYAIRRINFVVEAYTLGKNNSNNLNMLMVKIKV